MFKDPISSIAQTPDGYLWLGTQFGLLRFDGVRPVLWQPPAGQHLPSLNIRGLFVSSDGRLWINTQLGLASLKGGTLTLYPEVPGQPLGGMLEDRDGTIWAGTQYPPPGRLCAIHSDRVQCYGDKGEFGIRVSSLLEDHAGNLWVGAASGLWRWKPGIPKRYPLVDFESSAGLVEIEKGRLLIAERDNLRQLVGGKVAELPTPEGGWHAQFSCLFRDRDGGLWIGTLDRGLVHSHQGRVDVYSRNDGLSSDYVRDIFEDREGNIWAATAYGLDRFRRTAVGTISVNHGLSAATARSVLATRDGGVWVGTLDGLNRLKDGQITVYRRAATLAGSTNRSGFMTAAREIADPALPSDVIQSLYEDERRRLWVSTHEGVAYFENGRFTPVPGVSGGVHAISGDSDGNIWMSENESLLRIVGQRVVQRIPWARLRRRTPAATLLPDGAGRGVWLGFRDGTGVALFKQDQIVASYDTTTGLGRGMIGNLHRDGDGTLWAATEEGLSRIRNGRVHTLTAKNGLPCDAVHWVIQSSDHAFWLYMACGLARVARPQLDAWAVAAAKGMEGDQQLQATVLDDSDGVRIHASAGAYTPQVSRSADGRIWFLPWDGVSVIDPGRLAFNALPPPVHIEQIVADGQIYRPLSDLRLPPRVRDLSIEYTALSLVAPEKVRFRYMLEGQDPEWKEVVDQRRVQYSNLPPGGYRFRVMASNNDGVWNDVGAVVRLAVAPAYYQTAWFQALGAVALVAMLWTAHRVHVRRLVHQFNLTLEARVDERTRIARALHDTLLQSFQGLLLLFESARRLLPEHPAEAHHRLTRALEEASRATTEARDAVQGLRSSTAEHTDPVRTLSTLIEHLTSDETGDAPQISVASLGPPRPLKPLVADEVCFIAAEALRNALRHAGADQITAEIHYQPRQFRARIRDDGRGFDAQALGHEPPAGHFGLPGMRERAESVGGSLEVWSKPGFGTLVEVSIPGAVAYTAPPRPRPRFSRLAFPQSWHGRTGPGRMHGRDDPRHG